MCVCVYVCVRVHKEFYEIWCFTQVFEFIPQASFGDRSDAVQVDPVLSLFYVLIYMFMTDLKHDDDMKKGASFLRMGNS